jgi:RND family efflux transporter MFP subunit
VQASVLSDVEVFVSSETGGRLLSVRVKEGQYVKKGQLIAKVDLKSLSDQKAELETSMALAKDVYDRQKRLWDKNIGSEIQYLQAENNYQRLQKSLNTLETQIAKANIYSPISGVVDKEFLKAGEIASPGAPIVQLFNPNKLKISADVPETYLGKIKRGDNVDINFPAIGKQIKKTISLMGRTIDPNNRTFKVEMVTSSEGGALKPNLLAELMFNDYTKKDAIVVPLEIVQEEVSGRKYVFVAVTKDGKDVAQKSYVKIGEGYEGDIIIEEGLNAGDQIIIDGARSVANGDLIKNMTK